MEKFSQVTQMESQSPDRPMKRVLIIEDNPVHRRLMENELRVDYNLASAADSQTALAYLSGDKSQGFDLVILDLLIPERVGELPSANEAIKVLSNCERGPVVVVVSGCATEHLRLKLEQLGVERVFEKPFSLTEFREYIDSLLSASEHKQPPYQPMIS